MAHGENRFELRPVDDDDRPDEEIVIRLHHGDESAPTMLPVNRPPASSPRAAAEPSHRLTLPAKESVEMRTHQPDVEHILGPSEADSETLEHAWGAESGRREPIPWGWFALIGLFLVGAVFWGTASLREGEEQIREIRSEVADHFSDEAAEDREAEELIGRIESSIRSMFGATTVEEMARWVRQPDRVLPLMQDYHQDHPVNPLAIEAISALQPITLERRADFWTARVVFRDGSKRDLLIEISEDGKPLVDWETLVCYQPMPWDLFATSRPRGRSFDFRVVAEPDFLFSHEFSDQDRWACFRLTAPASDETLFGYARVDGIETQEILRSFREKGGRPVSLVLRLAIPDGLTSPRGVMIEKILSRHWAYLDPPDTPAP